MNLLRRWNQRLRPTTTESIITETASKSITETTSELTSESSTEFTSTTSIESTTESPTESTTEFSTRALETSTNIETSTESPLSSSTEFTSSSSSSTLSSSSVTTTLSIHSSQSTFTSTLSTQSTTANGIQCQLFNIDSSTEMFFPQPTKQLFNQGESVNVYCRFGRVHLNGKTSMQFNCTSNGEWDDTGETEPCLSPSDIQLLSTITQSTSSSISSSSTQISSTTSNGIQCQLFNIDSSTEMFFPQPTKQLFNQGESVNVYCRFGRVHLNGKTSMPFTCTSNGEWNDTAGTQKCSLPTNAQADPTTTAPSTVTCPQLNLYLNNTLTPKPGANQISGPQPVGIKIAHVCQTGYFHKDSLSPINIYVCLVNGQWSRNSQDSTCIDS